MSAANEALNRLNALGSASAVPDMLHLTMVLLYPLSSYFIQLCSNFVVDEDYY